MNKIGRIVAGMALLCSTFEVYAGDVIYRYRMLPNRPPEAIVSGLVNMTDLLNKPGDGCEQFIGLVKVEGPAGQHLLEHVEAGLHLVPVALALLAGECCGLEVASHAGEYGKRAAPR